MWCAEEVVSVRGDFFGEISGERQKMSNFHRTNFVGAARSQNQHKVTFFLNFVRYESDSIYIQQYLNNC